MIIDNVYDLFDNNLSENENLSKDNNFSESENETLLSLLDSSDDNDAVDILQEGLYSDDEFLSDFDDINLSKGNIYI
jgi:hypothetical protein